MSVRQTSIDAYVFHENTSGALSKKREELYRVICQLPERPATSNEIYRAHKDFFGRRADLTNHNVPARLGELRDRDVIFEAGTKVCPITGETVIAWDVTNRVANNKFDKKLTKAEQERLRCLKICEDEEAACGDIFGRTVALKIHARIAGGK